MLPSGRLNSWSALPTVLKEMGMKKTLTALTAAAIITGSLAATATDASAQWRRGWGPGAVVGGIIAGTVITGAILASRPRGYVVYDGYAQPVYGPGCYWASQPLYDRWGNVVGYSGRPVQVCPGYRY
jgi:hypothetical protein